MDLRSTKVSPGSGGKGIQMNKLYSARASCQGIEGKTEEEIKGKKFSGLSFQVSPQLWRELMTAHSFGALRGKGSFSSSLQPKH